MPERSNHVVGFLFAAVAVYALHRVLASPSLGLLGGAGIAAYLLGVVLDAWIRITLFWYRRGTRGLKTWRCGGCGKRIHWKPRDWVLECKSCGWKPGPPGIRWIWYSIPVVQARRRRLLAGAVRTSIAAAVIVGILLLPIGGAAVVESVMNDTLAAVDDVNLQTGDQSSVGTPSDRMGADQGGVDSLQTPSPTTTAASEITVPAVEVAFLQLLNQERLERGLGRVSTRSELTEMGVSHSGYMREAGRIGHDGLGDGTIKSRFQQRGLLPECRISTENNRFYPGAENAGQTWVRRNVLNSDNAPSRIDSNEDLAKALFLMWMNSPPHRKPMMATNLESIGLGFVKTSSGKVFAALEMCGS